MENTLEKQGSLFQFRNPKNNQLFFVRKNRMLVGRTEACEIVLNDLSVTAIHCVVEVSSAQAKVYDLNSRTGTFVNSKRIISETLKQGDILKVGNVELIFEKSLKNIRNENLPLEMLTDIPQIIPPTFDDSTLDITLPVEAPLFEEIIPRIEYPLAKDPKADFTEYIFEDVEHLYPIFKYNHNKTSVEVIILFQDRIFSIDYLPDVKNTYKLVGVNPGKDQIVYPYLGKEEKVDFITINKSILVHPLYGYDLNIISDNESKKKQINSNNTIELQNDDIFQFSKDQIQIFVRNTEKPPKVAVAPYFRRDRRFRFFLFIMLLVLSLFTGIVMNYEIDQEEEKDKAPKRIATILYREKLTVKKSPAISSTKNKPKDVIQKSPKQTVTKEVKKDTQQTNKKVENEKNEPIGTKTSKSTDIPKKANPKQGKDNKLTKVIPNQSTKSKSSSSSAKSNSKNRGVNRGHVDTYKSKNFTSALSSMLSKGGLGQGSALNNSGSDGFESGTFSNEPTATRPTKAAVSQHVGDLSGATDGKLDTTQGTEGIVSKKVNYVAGIPNKTVVLGGMDPDLIWKELVARADLFTRCYQRALSSGTQKFDGIVSFNFTIGASGHVSRAAIKSETGSIPSEVKMCTINIIRGIKFPEPPGGGIVEVNQPFNYNATLLR
ncbi:MAG: FHA domain-containing protein [Halobacteriovoraceae bacterium]|nr:FHA domain-containing protein [Halobacteriovoraceae bacterium]